VSGLLPIHIAAGSVGIITGYVALSAGKGGTVHKKSGLAFVYAMAVMVAFAAMIYLMSGRVGSAIGALIAPYLAFTGLTTVRPLGERWRWLDAAGVVVVAAVAVFSLMGGVEAVQLGGSREGVPAPMLFLFAAVAILAGAGDIRVMRNGPLTGTARIARHLWRMCYAMWIATGSFFIGQMDEFPRILQHPLFYVPPAIVPLIAMFYWLWRIRVRRSLRGIVVKAAGSVRRPLTAAEYGD
jgi:hypothetical protein